MPKTPAPTFSQVTTWITAAAMQQPQALHSLLMVRLGVSRRSASRLLRKLVDSQWLLREGSRRRPVFHPGVLRQVVQRYELAGLQEDLPWKRDFAPFLELAPNVRRMAAHAFTELLNNAIDHSGGQRVTVSVRQTALHLQLLVSDDGCGLFQRVAQAFDISDPQQAMFELSKGKLTSQPARHSGHGLFFTARLADVFDIHTAEAAFQYRPWSALPWKGAKPATGGGTSVYLAIALDSTRTLDSVLRAHSASGEGLGFERTRVPLHLLADSGTLASRAEARRVAQRLAHFQQADIDFSGLHDIGHGFADELFRVVAQAHPGLRLQALGMAPQVQAMLASVQAAGATVAADRQGLRA
jgi:anti-sigma regulatory factor (Ser/Thr protein kinase)